MAKTPSEHVTTKELPAAIRPRERLMAGGPEQMSDSELLAIVLGTGMKGMTSLRMAENILSRFDKRVGKLGAAVFDELAGIQGVGFAKAAQLLAAIELGKRVAGEQLVKRQSLSAPEKVAELLMPKMRHFEREHFMALIVNTKIQLVKMVEVAIGSLNAAIIHPRELYKAVIRANGAGVIVAHNHPSGEVMPSRDDIILTRRLAEAGRILGLDFIDHVIIGDGVWLSMKERGYLAGS